MALMVLAKDNRVGMGSQFVNIRFNGKSLILKDHAADDGLIWPEQLGNISACSIQL